MASETTIKPLIYSLTLTTRTNMTKEAIRANVKNALDSLHRKATSKKRRDKWFYILYGSLSMAHASKGTYGHWHAHFIIYGRPCSVIIEELRDYWYGGSLKHGTKANTRDKRKHKEKIGLASFQSAKRCSSDGWFSYIVKNELMTSTVDESLSTFIRTANITPAVLSDIGIDKVNKRNVIAFFSSAFKNGIVEGA